MAPSVETIAFAALSVWTLAPLFVQVNSNLNVVVTACLTVFVGCHRSVKPEPPAESMSKEHAMRFPFIGSAVLFGLFLVFKFLPKNLVNNVITLYFVFLGVVALTATIWPYVARYVPRGWNKKSLKLQLPYFKDFRIKVLYSQLLAALPAVCFCAWYALKKHWLANNVLGIAYSIEGIEMLSVGSFKIGGILLAGLFIYDIFWVFCTPVMVSVAKAFDAPVKVLFPTGVALHPFSMLGLGDIVLPGIFVALALRFDVSRKKGPKYFISSFAGYVFGITVTLIFMNVFRAAQPALLYIVPSVSGFLAVHCAIEGEIKQLLEFDESPKLTESPKLNEAKDLKQDESSETQSSQTDKKDE